MHVFVFSERRVHHSDLVESACDFFFFSRDQRSKVLPVAHLISKMLETDLIRLNNIDYYHNHAACFTLLISGSSVAPYASSQKTQLDQTTKRTSFSFPLSVPCFTDKKIRGNLRPRYVTQSRRDLHRVGGRFIGQYALVLISTAQCQCHLRPELVALGVKKNSFQF